MATTSLPHSTTPMAERPGRLPLLPALDGLRAMAIIAVLLYHADVRRVRGGFLGVESFFVVSGYLITSLLWTEATSTGRLRLPAFWMRRARRLLPALGGVVLVTTIAMIAFYRDMVANTRAELASVGVYISNWYLIIANQSYFAQMDRESPFRHLWSLAVEEQFYLLFPILFGLALFLIGRRPRRLAVIAGIFALGSAVEMWVLYVPAKDPSRVYYGTDTRASGLLIGVALALLWRPWERPDRGEVASCRGHALPTHWPDLLAGFGALVLVFTALKYAPPQDAVYRGGIQIVALATALVITGSIVPRSFVGRFLGSRVLTAIGRRSYSLYLWHWPVYVVTRPTVDLPWTSGPVLVIRLALTAALAEASYRLVERPVRGGALLRLRGRLRHALATAPPEGRTRLKRRWAFIGGAVALALAVVAFDVIRATPPPPLFSTLSSNVNVVVPSQPEPGPQSGTATTPAAAPNADGTPAASAPSTVATTTTTNPPAVVYAVGDSVMLGAAEALSRAVPGIAINASVGRQMSEGIDIVRTLAAAHRLPKVLLYHLGNNGDLRPSEFDDLVAAAGTTQIVIVTVQVTRSWEGPNNDMIRGFAHDHPKVRMLDWKNIANGCPGTVFFGDGTHLRPDGQNCYAAHVAQLVLAP